MNKKIIFATMVIIFTLILAIFLFINYNNEKKSTNSQTIDPLTIKNESDCVKNSGVWKIWGLSSVSSCNIHSSDSDKPCTDGSQCESKACVAQASNTDNPPSGRCHQWMRLIGVCLTLVENGKTGSAICVD